MTLDLIRSMMAAIYLGFVVVAIIWHGKWITRQIARHLCGKRREENLIGVWEDRNIHHSTKAPERDISPNTPKGTYDVFLSFRGPDTRQGLVDCLYHFMIDAGIRVFKDDEDLRPGEKIVEVFEAIKCSRICIPIFSRDYPSSKWCMRELAKMVELDKQIVPMFYDVTSDDVKLQTNLYRQKLRTHRRVVANEKTQWETALVEVASISGYELGNKGYGEFSKLIARKISLKLKVKERTVADYLVGMDDQVNIMMGLLEVESDDVRYIGIHGMGGVGKTTLAKVIFNELHASYNGCSFAENVREMSKSKGVACLQKQLLDNLGSVVTNFYDSDDGIRNIRSVVHNQKILIVLDDVDQMEQIERLAGKSFPFGPGSRIIITTRNINILKQLGEARVLEMTGLGSDPALQLFSRHAFKTASPPPNCFSLSKSIVSITRGLPLALEVVGSLLYLKGIDEWEEITKSIGTNSNIQKVLMISYEALEARTREIFLDIACFFNNEEKTNCMFMWRACNFYPKKGLEELISLSLVKISNGNRLWMHDLLVDLGREIVRMENLMDVTKRSRLWTNEDASAILQIKEGRENIQALRMGYNYRANNLLTNEELKELRNLRFLEMHGFEISGNFKGIFLNLKWLSWHSCPSKLEASNVNLPNLVVLDLSRSKISETWKQIQMENLEVLILERCQRVSNIVNFSKYKNLERLILEGCYDLTEIDRSISMVMRLKLLDLRGCVALKGLPEEIGQLEYLEEILMRGDGGAFTLPKSIGNLKSLSVLKIEQVTMTELPHSIGRLEKLRQLSLPYTGLDRIPYSLGKLKLLVELDLSGASMIKLPDSFTNMKEMKVLKIKSCKLRELRAIREMKMLEELDACRNTLMLGLPVEIGSMSHLRVLNLSLTGISRLPLTVDQLSCLQTLDLTDCHCLQELPKLPTGLTSLRVSSQSFKKVPDLSELVNLTDLMLSNAANHTFYFHFSRAPATSRFGYPIFSTSSQSSTGLFFSPELAQSYNLEWLRNLTKLESLHLDLSIKTTPPSQLNNLSHLKTLQLSCHGWESFPQLPSSLTSLTIGYYHLTSRLPVLSNLGNLKFLCFFSCSLSNKLHLEMLGVRLLQRLIWLHLIDCNFTELDAEQLPRSLRLRLTECRSLKTIKNLPNINKVELFVCKQLSEITTTQRGLGYMEIIGCKSLERCLETLRTSVPIGPILKWSS